MLLGTVEVSFGFKRSSLRVGAEKVISVSGTRMLQILCINLGVSIYHLLP